MTEKLLDVDLTLPPPGPDDTKDEETKEPTSHAGVQPEEKKEKTLGDILAAFPGSPDDVQIEKWKQIHGEVLCSGFTNHELFVFRPITRQEFVNLQMYVSEYKVNSFEVEQKIVETCLLWGSPPGMDSLEKKAGGMSTLHEQILQESNFINPAYAAQFVTKL